ncbi:OmpW/AlkL family protein [Acinetobacter sp.]|uniref:OmpW/AlkL family protein n=1 Tax=Acinetobacter sp. TaxID=472 RepID=UPI002FCA346C
MLKQAAFIALLGMSASAMAGQWQVKIGGSALAPQNDDNGTLNIPLAAGGSAAMKAEVSNEINFTPSIEYIFANSPLSVELLLAAPLKHDVNIGAIDDAASFKHLPPTITAKYNFKNSTRFTPYVGVGATVVVPWDETLSQTTKDATGAESLDADIAYGVAGQVGFNFQPADAKNWGVFADVRYANVKTELTAKTPDGTKVKLGDLEVNPWVYTIGYSYKF